MLIAPQTLPALVRLGSAMANRVPTQSHCTVLGCKEPKASKGLCVKHGGMIDITEERKAFNGMYQTAQWRAIRTRQLSQHPLCASCLCSGRVSSAVHVDHVFPWSRIGKKAFAINVYQSLCHECHSVKTAGEKANKLVHYLNGKAIEYTLNDWARVCEET